MPAILLAYNKVQIQNLGKYCCDWVAAAAKQWSRMSVREANSVPNTEFLSLSPQNKQKNIASKIIKIRKTERLLMVFLFEMVEWRHIL